ncbi:hypothetical protein M406DRAFT_326852 [Cryphonectria parasitica EP155]|uniref:Uncharacterized protein n=1 Tax=Cryphonectria parasitica (strain ATCC 38755 / EP155) TaxID=660469 RepID=A0A9P4Y929_CRYP1|nr:uncharacterized protein M406DRAFT_326852 [Cryphonectria parasitica EP155]KAF3768300.1 hypothetical protein M406DRAFT_326852 [Cryphonectria parasitica EP155]
MPSTVTSLHPDLPSPCLPAVFGRFVPKYGDLGIWAPEGIDALRVWQLRCPRGRPFVCVVAELAEKKNRSCLEGVIKDLAELVVTPLMLNAASLGECRDEAWMTFKYRMLPSLLLKPRGYEKRAKREMRTDYARNTNPELSTMPLSDMSILVKPDLSGIACVMEWRVSPLPFGASLAAVQCLLGTNLGNDDWLYYPSDPFELSRLLIHSVHYLLCRETNTVLKATGRRRLLVAMRFGYAFDFGPKVASDPRRFRTSHLSRVMCAFEEL